MECFFLNDLQKCRILVNTTCSEKCKFRCTADEFLQNQRRASEILKRKGLEATTKRVGNKTIVTTRGIEK
jgi:hypothetical protein